VLHYREQGEGEPLIAIHGLFGSLENLGVIARQLAQTYKVYSVDLPNHGRSKHVDNVDLSVMADMVVSVLDTLSIERAHFLGHSLGGKVAMEIALTYPERVAHLVIADIAPVQYSARHQDVFDGFNAIDLEQVRDRKEADALMAQYVPEVAVRSFLLKNLLKTDTGFRWRVNVAGIIHDYPQLIAANCEPDRPFAGPVLFVKAEHSDYLLPQYREPIISRFPRANVRVINNTGHWLHAEKPDVFSGIVSRFLVGA